MEKLNDITYNSEVIQQLMQVHLLKSLKEEDILKLLKLSKIKEYKAGEAIIQEGDDDSRIYYLVWGKVKIIKRGVEISVLQDVGNIFGEMASLDGEVRSASVYAVVDTMCLEIDISNIDEYRVSNQMEFKYKIYQQFSEVLAGRLRLTTNELIQTKNEAARLKEECENLKLELEKLTKNKS